MSSDSKTLALAEKKSIRELGHDEYWLQNYIWSNPSCLGLGELEALSKERVQSSGGRLDILLKRPEDSSMFEVEVMLGETDETHIIRTIEYWDNEKRRWPQRQHTAVLVAENINRRFFNVIHLLSHSIPIIAIQVSLLTDGSNKSLFFSTVLDTYEEVDDGAETSNYSREDWAKLSKWTLESADAILAAIKVIFVDAALRFTKHYIAFSDNGRNRMWLHKRGAGKSLLGFKVNIDQVDEVSQKLEKSGFAFVVKVADFAVTIDRVAVEKNQNTLAEIATLIHQK